MGDRTFSLASRILPVILAVLWSSVHSVSAQITSGSVAGLVVDAQGGVVSGATVVLINEKQGTRSAPAVTGPGGTFVFPNTPADTYTLEVALAGFKTVKRTGISLSPGDRLALGVLTIEVGAASEIVNVTTETVVQAASGERSFTVSQKQIESLPMASRSFQAFAALAPGVEGTSRLGGGGGTNFMIDGVVTMDPGSGILALQVSAESIAEVRVLTSGYQAEYGRTSGLQVTAVTKSGSNQFHGGVYDVERHSKWNATSRVNVLNGDPKPTLRQRDWGWSVGGPVGRANGNNKLFFFYAQEFNPRTAGGNVVRFRMPTALERKGDFSRSYDNNGTFYPYIKDPLLAGSCNAESQPACFNEGGMLGRIPTERLYGPGVAILNWWPAPNIDGAGLPYNYELTRPNETALGYQPVLRLDYQPAPTLRLTGKYVAYAQRDQAFAGNLPGFTDTRQSKPITPSMLISAALTVNPTTFVEGTWGHTNEQQEGCTFAGNAGSPGPLFCANAIAQHPLSNYSSAGFGDLPLLFPTASIIDQRYHAFDIMQQMRPPFWDGRRIWRAPTFAFGSRVTNQPPGTPFPPFLQSGGTHDLSLSVTRLAGTHTFKAGYYFQSELHTRNGGASAFGTLNFQQDAVGTNPFDTSFGYANAAIGSFSAYTQNSKYIEGRFVYYQNEFFVQDNWKIRPNLTLDYGVRFVNQQPYYDKLKQGSNFLPERWQLSAAPLIYVAGCANNSYPCSGSDRRAMHPVTLALLGEGSATAIGAIVRDSGDVANGLFVAGNGISGRTFTWPVLATAPRVGVAYDLTGEQRFVIRGSTGLYYDRPSANAAGTYAAIGNPPISESVTVRNGQLQSLGTAGLSTLTPSALRVIQYDSPLPTSAQWNVGAQMLLPWDTTADVSYVGQHSYNTIDMINLNTIDLGTAFLESTRDPSAAASAVPGAASYASTSPDLIRSFRGFGAITQSASVGWRTYHSVQISLNRRFRNGLSFGFNDTIGISDKENAPTRLEHTGPGQYRIRSDQADADRLLGDNHPSTHLLRANVVWDLPDLTASQPLLRTAALVLNDWQLSSIWSGARAAAYAIGVTYQSGGNVNVTGSPDFQPRVLVTGDPGSGCSQDPTRQFDPSVFRAPAKGSVGLESGNGYLRGCFISTLDIALARNIRLGRARVLQLRVDVFNVPNAAGVTARNATMNVNSPIDPTVANLPVDANGVPLPSRMVPRGAGFGVATNYQAPRSIQAQIRLSF